MSRYIDIEAFNDWHDDGYDLYAYYNALEKAPHIDIVRCKECRYCKRKRGTFKGEPIIFYRCTENNRDIESDDYCSWGERESE